MKLQLTGIVLLSGLAAGLVGCSCRQGEPAGNVEGGAEVTLIRDDGQFARVRRADGQELYLPSALLKQRSQADGSQGDHTHVVTTDTAVYRGGPPGTLPLPPPRPRQEILREQVSLNGLFLTENTLREVIAPITSMPTFQGERCWPAYTCTNPDCPGKGKQGRPYLFINPKPGTETVCPACMESRDVSSESEADKRRYRNYPVPYELPETVRRIKQLDAERKRAIEAARNGQR